MNTERLKNLMYEAEGLLELLTLRPEKRAEIQPLIRARVAEILATLDADESDAEPAEESSATESSPEETFEKELEYESALEVEPEPEEESEEEPEEEPESEEEPEPEPFTQPKRDVPAFCLNDRFRFRRAIFGGNNDDFVAAMNHLATLDSYAEAEEFLLGDLYLNPEDPDVVDFMAIIKKYYDE